MGVALCGRVSDLMLEREWVVCIDALCDTNSYLLSLKTTVLTLCVSVVRLVGTLSYILLHVYFAVIGPDLYENTYKNPTRWTVYGGHLAAVAVKAALLTFSPSSTNILINSVHASFINH